MTYLSDYSANNTNSTSRWYSAGTNTTWGSSASAFGCGSADFGLNNAMFILMLSLIGQILSQLQQQNSGSDDAPTSDGDTSETETAGDHCQPAGDVGNTGNTENTGGADQTTNTAPTVEQDATRTDANTPVSIDVLANDSDADGDIVSVDSFTQAANGTVTQQGDRLVYTPNAGFSGHDSFTYTATDGKGGLSSTNVSVLVYEPLPETSVDKGTIKGDPHFVGADGGRYDVQGEAGKTYNILSDQNVQVNSTFAQYGNKGATVMGQIGITDGKNQIEIGTEGQLSINGTAITEAGEYLNSTVIKSAGAVDVTVGEYAINIDNSRAYLNASFQSDNVAADGVMPHGLWGQTADGDGIARNGDKGAGAQGGGAIETLAGEITERGDKTTVAHYEVESLFDTSFTHFNRFSGDFGEATWAVFK